MAIRIAAISLQVPKALSSGDRWTAWFRRFEKAKPNAHTYATI
jgi:hypothetical protein